MSSDHITQNRIQTHRGHTSNNCNNKYYPTNWLSYSRACTVKSASLKVRKVKTCFEWVVFCCLYFRVIVTMLPFMTWQCWCWWWWRGWGGEVKTFLIVSSIVVLHVKSLNLSDMATRIRFTRDEKKDDKCDGDSQDRKFICERLISEVNSWT